MQGESFWVTLRPGAVSEEDRETKAKMLLGLHGPQADEPCAESIIAVAGPYEDERLARAVYQSWGRLLRGLFSLVATIDEVKN